MNNPIRFIDPNGMGVDDFIGSAGPAGSFERERMTKKNKEVDKELRQMEYDEKFKPGIKNWASFAPIGSSDGDGNENDDENEEQQQPYIEEKEDWNKYILSENPHSQSINEDALNEAIYKIRNGDDETKKLILVSVSYGTNINIDVTNMDADKVARTKTLVESEWAKAKKIITSKSNSDLTSSFSQKSSNGLYYERNGRQFLTYPNITAQSASNAILIKARIVGRAKAAGVKNISIDFTTGSQTSMGIKKPRA